MSRAKHTPNRLPLLTKFVVWLRRLPVRVRAMLRGGGPGGPATTEDDNSARIASDLSPAAPAEPSPDFPVPAVEVSDTCERDAGEEPVTAKLLDESLHVPSPGANAPEPPPDPASVVESSEPCEREAPSGESVIPDEPLGESPHATTDLANDLAHDSASLQERSPHVSVLAEPSEAVEREASSASEGLVTPEKLLDESLHLTNDLPYGLAPAVAAEPCEQEALNRTVEPISPEALLDESLSVANDQPHDSADLPAPLPDVPVAAEPSEPRAEPIISREELPDELLHLTNDQPHDGADPHDSADQPEPPSDVPAPAELGEANQQEAPRASEEPVTPEELPDECLVTNEPHDRADLPFSAPAPAERQALSVSAEPISPEELPDESLHVTNDLAHDSASLQEQSPDVSVLAESSEAVEREAPSASEGPVTPEELLDESLHLTNDLPDGTAPAVAAEPCEQEALNRSPEPVIPEALLDEPLPVAKDQPHDSADLPAPLPDVPVAAEPSQPRAEPIISREELPDELLHLQPHDGADPHDSADLPEPPSDVPEPGEANQQDAPRASEEPVTPEELRDECLVTNESHDRADLPEPFSVPVPAEREALSVSAEPISPEELPDESLHVTTDLPHDSGAAPDVPTPAAEPCEACEQDVPSAGEERPPEALLDECPATELSKACEREALIRRRWMETGIKMWNPRIHGTGDVTLSIQGRVELLAPAPGETVPRYDKLEFKVFNGQIVCEGVTVEEQHSDHSREDVAPTHRGS